MTFAKELPSGWESVKLGKLVDISSGFSFKSKLFKHEGFPIIRIGNINNGYISDKNLDYEIKLKNMITVDSYVKQNNLKPDVIKIDVEGAEELVFLGASNVLENFKPLIFLSIHPKLIKNYGSTAENLKAAIAGETHEYTDMYPGMARTAREEGFDEIADWFETLAKAERSHAGRFQKALDTLAD